MADRRESVSDYINRGWVPFAYAGQFTPGAAWQHSEVDENTLDLVSKATTPVGLLLGKASGLVCIDLDARNGSDVKAFFDHYNLPLHYTRVHKSASPGSFHVLFSYPENIDFLKKTKGNRTGVPALAGADLLADGTNIVAPPSVRVGHPDGKPDGQYSVAVDKPVQAMPEALLVDWLSAVSRSTPEGKPTGEIKSSDIDWVLGLHKRNIEIAALAEPGTRDDVCTSRIGSSIRIALAMPDVVLSADKVREDFVTGVPYEIKDIEGKIERAVAWAEQHAWKEMEQEEGELPDGVPITRASEYFDELTRLRIREAAKRTFRVEEVEREAAYTDIGEIEDGLEFFNSPPLNPRWVVNGLIQHAGSALLAGQYKAGKSTLMVNLIQALTMGDKFLGKFQVQSPMKVGYVDMELGRDMAQRWLSDVPNIDRERVSYLGRMGRGYTMNMRSEELRNKWVRLLIEKKIEVLIIDPLSPIMSALGVDENSSETVRPLLDSLDTLKIEAGLAAIVVSHHTGHQNTSRARGSTAFMDWATSYMSVVRQSEDFNALRTFQASGRDVSVHPEELQFNPQTRLLSLSGRYSMGEESPW